MDGFLEQVCFWIIDELQQRRNCFADDFGHVLCGIVNLIFPILRDILCSFHHVTGVTFDVLFCLPKRIVNRRDVGERENAKGDASSR